MANVRLRLELSGVGIEFSGSQAFYDRWVEPIVAATCQRSALPGAAAPLAPSTSEPAQVAAAPEARDAEQEPAKPMFQPENPARFQQFVAQVGNRASSSEQQLMAFGFYLWNYEKRNAFAQDDIAGFFGLLQQDVPDDVDARIGDLVERKRFLEVDADVPEGATARWKLTTKGVNYVKNRLLGSV